MSLVTILLLSGLTLTQAQGSVPYLQDFEGSNDLDDWQVYSVSSDSNWKYDEFSGDHFAAITNHEAQNNAN